MKTLYSGSEDGKKEGRGGVYEEGLRSDLRSRRQEVGCERVEGW